MDLSKAAAGKLGFINQGTANVRVEQVLPGSGETLAANAGSGRNIYVNLKSFGSEAEAKSYLSQTSRHLNSAQSAQKVVMVKQNNQYVVRMGPFAHKTMPTAPSARCKPPFLSAAASFQTACVMQAV